MVGVMKKLLTWLFQPVTDDTAWTRFIGRLIGLLCIGLGLPAWVGWGDWSGVAIGVFTLAYAWAIKRGWISE